MSSFRFIYYQNRYNEKGIKHKIYKFLVTVQKVLKLEEDLHGKSFE
ncbi:hypothetical protein [uncultured Clostridium sp.]|nr:hypothetical protein [uncultured Clostridium sp.]